MFLVLMLLSYIGTFVALRKLAGDAFSTFGTVCATFILSPALVFFAARLIELASGGGTGFAGAFVVAVVGLPLAVLAMLALFVGALAGLVRADFGSSAQVLTEPSLLCGQCGHPAGQHYITAVIPPQLACRVDGCACALSSPDIGQSR